MRDEFSEEVKRTLAGRVNHVCSNPDCCAQTSGPQIDPSKVLNVGVAAHITAASLNGPRYDRSLSAVERGSPENGIWLCQNCAKLIDNDASRYTEQLLRAWKVIAEDRARNSIGKTASSASLRLAPSLGLHLERIGVKQDPYSRTPLRYFELGLENGEGCAIAKFPSIRYRLNCGLTCSPFGIDGNWGVGLPQVPSEREWQMFRGGTDHVIHPGETLKITQLVQTGRNVPATAIFPDVSGRWSFGTVTFRCEISAEGIATTTTEKTFPEETVSWAL